MKFPPNIKRLISMHRPYAGRLIMAFVLMAVVAATEPAVPWLFKLLLDKGFVKKPTFSLWLVPVIIVGLFMIRGIANFCSSYLMTWTSSHLLVRLREKMFDRMLTVPIDFYTHTPVGKVIQTIMGEVGNVLNIVTTFLPSVVRFSLTLLGLIFWLFYINWKLALLMFALLPMFIFILRFSAKRLRAVNRELVKLNSRLTQNVSESARSHQVVKIFGGQDYERSRFMTLQAEVRRNVMRVVRISAAVSPITQAVFSCALASVIVFALQISSAGELSVGDFVSFITAMLMMVTPMRQLANINGRLQQGMVSVDTVFEFINTPTERTGGALFEGRAKGQVDYVDVSFSYAEDLKPALDQINLNVQPGETIALVGASGGGKTTFVNLLPAFYTPTSGQILLDGMPINDTNLASLRDQMAMVSQHVVLVNDTVVANVAYGDANPDLARVHAAIDAAYLTNVVEDLVDGVNSLIGDNGYQLSGGQRQRLAIARAIYKDAPILILDEATSALDTESERMVQMALEKLMVGRTTFVIAHRLSTIEHADRIVVISDGKIVEVGSHEELLQAHGAYESLYRLQFSADA